MAKERDGLSRKDIQDLFLKCSFISGSFVVVPDILCKISRLDNGKNLSWELAPLLSWLCRKSAQMKAERRDGWFYQIAEDIYLETDISPTTQQRLIKELKKSGFIEVRVAGRPPKKHFRIKWRELANSITIALKKYDRQNLPFDEAWKRLQQIREKEEMENL